MLIGALVLLISNITNWIHTWYRNVMGRRLTSRNKGTKWSRKSAENNKRSALFRELEFYWDTSCLLDPRLEIRMLIGIDWKWRVIIAVNFQFTGRKKPEKYQGFNGICFRLLPSSCLDWITLHFHLQPSCNMHSIYISHRYGLVICKNSIAFSEVHNDLLIFVQIATIWCFQERFLSIIM